MESGRCPIDTGYSWVVCAASSLTFFVTMGVCKSLGVMLLEFQAHFKSEPSITSLTVALVAAGFFMFVFLSNTMGLFLGNRNVAVGGACLAFVSMLVTAFAPNIFFVVIFLGLLSGIAYSGLFGPPLVILSSYFQKRRALATGLAVAGGSLGQLSIPLLFDFLVQFYGFQGGILIFSAVVMHAIPGCMLLRPPTFWNRKTKNLKNGSQNDSAKQDSGCCKRFINVLRVMMDMELLCDKIFLMMSVSTILGHLGYFSSVIFLPSCANSFFNNRTLSVILVSVMGVCDLVGRLLGGYLADLGVLKINDLMGISLLVPGVVTVFAGLFPAVWLMFVSAVSLGSFAGAYTALLTPMIIEYFGLAKVSPGFGILTFLMGFLIAPCPTVLSLIFVATGTYKSVLTIAGTFLAVGGTMFILMRFVLKKDNEKDKTTGGNNENYTIPGDPAEDGHSDILERKSELGSTLALTSTGYIVKEHDEGEDDVMVRDTLGSPAVL